MWKYSVVGISILWLALAAACDRGRSASLDERQPAPPSNAARGNAARGANAPLTTNAPEPLANILVVLTSHARLGDTGKQTGFYLSEVSHVYYELRHAGVDVTFASIRGGLPPIDAPDRSDEENARFLDDTEAMEAISNIMPLASAKASDYDAVYFPGGHGTMWDFPGNADIDRLTRAIWERGGVVAALCHGPSALTEVKLSDGSYLVAGRDMAAFTDMEEKAAELDNVVPFLLQSRLEERGARVHTAANWQPKVVVSGRLITGQNPASAKQLAHHLVQALKTYAQNSEG